MGESHDRTPDGVSKPNAAVVAGLREIADLLEDHPEVPQVNVVAWVSDYRYGEKEIAAARSELTTFAAALGDRATEERRGDLVRIAGEFHGIALHAEAKVAHLRGEPQPEPDYEPILARETVSS